MKKAGSLVRREEALNFLHRISPVALAVWTTGCATMRGMGESVQKMFRH